MKPSFNLKFHQYEITWSNPDGSYGGVWGNTEEECLKRYNETRK